MKNLLLLLLLITNIYASSQNFTYEFDSDIKKWNNASNCGVNTNPKAMDLSNCNNYDELKPIDITNFTLSTNNKNYYKNVCTGNKSNCRDDGNCDYDYVIHYSFDCTWDCTIQESDCPSGWVANTDTCACEEPCDLEPPEGFFLSTETAQICYGTAYDELINKIMSDSTNKKYLEWFCDCPAEFQNPDGGGTVWVGKLWLKFNPDYDTTENNSTSTNKKDCPSNSTASGDFCYCNLGYWNINDDAENGADPICALLPNDVNFSVDSHMPCTMEPQLQEDYNDHCIAAHHEKAILYKTDVGSGLCYFEFSCTGDFRPPPPNQCEDGFIYDSFQRKCIPFICDIDCDAELSAIKSYCDNYTGECRNSTSFCYNSYTCNDTDYNTTQSTSDDNSTSDNTNSAKDKCTLSSEVWNGRECVCKRGYYRPNSSLFCRPIPNDNESNTSVQQDYQNYLSGGSITKEQVQRAVEDALKSYKASTTDNQIKQLKETNTTNNILSNLLKDSNTTNGLLGKILGESNTTNGLLGKIANLLSDINESNGSSAIAISGGGDSNLSNDDNSSNDSNSSDNGDSDFRKLVDDFSAPINAVLSDLNTTIQNIQTNGFTISAIPEARIDTCNYQREFILPSPMSTINLNIDICKITSKSYEILYFVFYILFFISGLYLVWGMIKGFR